MADAYHHSLSSAKRWGGEPAEYMSIHVWFDQTKASMCDQRHRALRHHAEGIGWCVEHFGPTLTLSTGRVIPTRWVAERHVQEDLGKIPTAADWLRCIKPERWMGANALKLSETLTESDLPVTTDPSLPEPPAS
jgi:hypothetical protein